MDSNPSPEPSLPAGSDRPSDLSTGLPPLEGGELDAFADNKPNPPSGTGSTFLNALALVGVLLLFFVSLEVMGDAFKGLGKSSFDLEGLLGRATNSPLLGLITGILVTSLVQSSSTTTTLTVTLVATGALSVPAAIPVIMGANIGTTVTNTIVSMGHITRPEEFRRAMSGATVHDFFNWMAVLVLLPLELIFGVLSKPALALAGGLTNVGGAELLSPVKVITDPAANFIAGLLPESNLGLGLLLGIGLIFLFISLRYLVVLLKALVLGRAEGIFHKYIFGAPLAAMACGLVLTFLVQSSSITTSLVVPLIGAGLISVRQVFPYMLGANVGTTLTAFLAALVLAAAADTEPELAVAALEIALVHVAFNVFGIVLIYPIKFLREIPIKMSEFVGDLAFKNRIYAIVYLVGLFYALPLLLEVLLSNI